MNHMTSCHCTVSGGGWLGRGRGGGGSGGGEVGGENGKVKRRCARDAITFSSCSWFEPRLQFLLNLVLALPFLR